MNILRPKISFLARRGWIHCRVSYNGTSCQFSTNEKLDNPQLIKNGKFHPRSPEDQIIADRLDEIYFEFKKRNFNPYDTARDVVDQVLGKATDHGGKIPQTISESLDYYLEFITAHKYNRTSIKNYTNTVLKWGKFLQDTGITEEKLHHIRRSTIRRFYSYMLDDGLAEGTAYQYVTYINGAIKHIVEEFSESEHAIKFNPVKGAVKRPKRVTRIDRYLSIDEVRLLEGVSLGKAVRVLGRSIELDWIRLSMLWQIHTGFSFSDLSNTKWEIAHQINGKIIMMNRVKSGVQAYIPYTDAIHNILEQLKAHQKKNDWPLLFPVEPFLDDKGKKIDIFYERQYNAYSKMLANLCKAVGLHKVVSHELRHTFGMLAFNHWHYPAEATQRMMGHSNLQTTMNHYAQVDADNISRFSNM